MPAVSDLSDHTGYLLRMVSNAVSQTFARKVASAGVTVAEWAVLRSLYCGEGLAPSALAQKMGMTKGAISKLADRLTGKGLVERAGNPDDKRAHKLSLTAVGSDLVPVLARFADENEAAFFAVLGDEDQDRLRLLLHTLIDRHALARVPID